MQTRHTNRKQYFEELAHSCEKHYLPFIRSNTPKPFNSHFSVLEIGCGEGGNLLPFAKLGCPVTGIDIAHIRIEQAIRFFEEEKLEARFSCDDIFNINPEKKYDLIVIHDVIEHIVQKQRLLQIAAAMLTSGGLIYIGFPAWRMPFGGHQQICHGKWVSRMPYIHLFPNSLYKRILRTAGEKPATIEELIDIKACKTSINGFKKTVGKTPLFIADEKYYFINPHYEVKFGLKPRLLTPFISKVPYLRDFFTTSYFCILKKKNTTS